jgi:hypothetical protein
MKTKAVSKRTLERIHTVARELASACPLCQTDVKRGRREEGTHKIDGENSRDRISLRWSIAGLNTSAQTMTIGHEKGRQT